MANRREILANIGSIAAMPVAAVEAICLAQEPDPPIMKLAEAIEYDPGLTSNVLRMANSAFFGFRRKISSIRDAIVQLGTVRVLGLVAASAYAPLARQEVKGYDLPPGQLWRHSAAVAIGAVELAHILNREAPDHTFTAALLHDVGKIVLGIFVEVDAEPILSLARSQNVRFDAAERQLLGIDHAELGSVLLAEWYLPPSITDTVRWHHQPERSPNGDPLAAELVHMADQICRAPDLAAGGDVGRCQPSDWAVADLKITPQLLELASSRIAARLDELADWFAPEEDSSLPARR